MSLADILAQHSRDLNANLAHTQEMVQDNVNRKAESLQEKVEHARDAIEAAGGEVAGAAAAWHTGRKIYAKYQKARQALAQKRGAEQPETNADSSGASEQSARANDPEPEEGGRGGDTTGEAPEQSSIEKPLSADAEEPEMNGGTAPEEQTPLAEEQTELTDIQQTIPKPEALSSEDLGYTPKPDEPSGDLARNIATDDSPPTTKPNLNDIKQAVDKEEPSAEGPTLEGAPENALEKIAGDTTQVAGEGGDSLLGDVAGSVAKKVASKAAGLGGDALAEGLSTAGEVLDFLGPVGEAAGVVTSLIGLLSGIGKKPEEDEESGEQTVGKQTVTTAIDPEALETKQAVGVQV